MRRIHKWLFCRVFRSCVWRPLSEAYIIFNVHDVSRAGYPPIFMWLDVIILTDVFYCYYFIFETICLPLFFRFSPHLLYNTWDKLGIRKYTQIYAVVPISGKRRVMQMRVIGSWISSITRALSNNSVSSEHFLLFMVGIWIVKSESSQSGLENRD
jgi:hypothetical protein